MTRLSHEQTKRFLNMATDHCLNPHDRADLEAHLAQCANCQTYAQEMNWLDGAIGRALRAKWVSPRRSPIDIAARVRHRMREQSEKRLLAGFANVFVKLGSLAIVMVLAVSLSRGQGLKDKSLAGSNNAASSNINLPRFEFEADGNTRTLSPVGAEDEQDLPRTPPNRLHASQY